MDSKVEDESPLDLDLDFDPEEFTEDMKSINFGATKFSGPKDDDPASTVLLDDAPDFPPEVPLVLPLEDFAPPEKTKVSFGAGKYAAPAKPQAPHFKSLGNNNLKQSESLRVAQNKINVQEETIDNLRRENESLASAGETFKKINDEYYASLDILKKNLKESKKTSMEEITLLKKMNGSKDRQIIELKRLSSELQSRLDNNFSGVRKREKDLEHRLEIAKIEEAAVIKSKDQLILDLKRRIDRIQIESENFRQKSQENYKDLQQKNQMIRGVMRALRLALTKLEGDDASSSGLEHLANMHSDFKKSG